MSGNAMDMGFGPDDQEQNIARFRAHGRRLVLPVVLLLVLAPSAAYFIGYFDELWQNVLVVVGASLLLVFGVLRPLLSWLTSRTVITTKRIIVREGIVTRRKSSVPFTRIRTVSTRKSLLQRLFGSGNIELDVADGVPILLEDVPGVEVASEALQQLIERSYRAHTRAQGFFTRA